MPDGDTDATLLPTDHQERLESDPEYRALWDAYWLARNPMVQAWRDAAPRPDCPGVGRPMPDGEGDRQVEKPWRVGRKVGNTIYVVGADRPFALMPTPELATHVVALHNAARAHE